MAVLAVSEAAFLVVAPGGAFRAGLAFRELAKLAAFHAAAFSMWMMRCGRIALVAVLHLIRRLWRSVRHKDGKFTVLRPGQRGTGIY